MKRAVFALSTLLAMHGALACRGSEFVAGMDMDRDELIREAGTIALVRVRSQVQDGAIRVYTMETVEVLKGNAPASYQYKVFSSPTTIPSDNDFDGHSAGEFLDKDAGRSKPGCAGPMHL